MVCKNTGYAYSYSSEQMFEGANDVTIPFERTRAVIQTREFLRVLQTTPRVPTAVRVNALRLLRHYPGLSDLDKAHLGAPNCWGPVPPFSRLSGTTDGRNVIDATKGQD